MCVQVNEALASGERPEGKTGATIHAGRPVRERRPANAARFGAGSDHLSDKQRKERATAVDLTGTSSERAASPGGKKAASPGGKKAAKKATTGGTEAEKVPAGGTKRARRPPAHLAGFSHLAGYATPATLHAEAPAGSPSRGGGQVSLCQPVATLPESCVPSGWRIRTAPTKEQCTARTQSAVELVGSRILISKGGGDEECVWRTGCINSACPKKSKKEIKGEPVSHMVMYDGDEVASEVVLKHAQYMTSWMLIEEVRRGTACAPVHTSIF